MTSFLIVCAALAIPNAGNAAEKIVFDRDVRPILSDRCFHCHGPNQHDRQADLRLDRGKGPDGAYQVIEPGSPDDSELWYRLTTDGDDAMPPADSSKKRLDAAQRETIKRWIEQGAEYTDFWAFVPPTRPPIPETADPNWGRNPIDRFVLRRLEAEGLAPKPRADRRTLIRRLSLDLTGLPPSRDDIADFLADASEDAYGRLVDRLLARPQYGEHMTRYWLDLVRFADTNGIHHDHFRDMSPYRDWVIRAFNDNLPYDKFVTYQLAGDLYPEPTRDQLVASGFNRLHLIIDRGTALPEESYTRNVIDRVTAVGTAFMGLTVQCAVCHDHKYDPLTTKDFYQLFAFFNNFDGEPETGGRRGNDFRRGLQPPYISLPTDEQTKKLAELDRLIRASQTRIAEVEQRSKKEADPSRQSALQSEATRAKEALRKLQAERQAVDDAIPRAMVMKERPEPRPAYVLLRGAYDRPGEQVQRDTPSFLPPLDKREGLPTRMDLARWFLSPRNPLTARVAVNRFWQQLFGVGLVKTAEDFGAQGEWPSHPELLDYLAVSFIESGWDVKALVKQMVMSETYRQSSLATPAEFKADPDNRLLARASRFRLDAEVIRDTILATSGLMNYQMYGRSVKPPQPPGLWKAVTMPSSYPRIYEPDGGDKIYRRSVYTFWKRGMPPPQMTILNAPSREECIARRERTNTPLQALLLLDEPEYLKAARHLARRTLADGDRRATARVAVLYETITARRPIDRESDVLLKLAADLEAKYRDDPELTDRLLAGTEVPQGVSGPELAAWTVVASTIYNLHVTKTRD